MKIEAGDLIYYDDIDTGWHLVRITSNLNGQMLETKILGASVSGEVGLMGIDRHQAWVDYIEGGFGILIKTPEEKHLLELLVG